MKQLAVSVSLGLFCSFFGTTANAEMMRGGLAKDKVDKNHPFNELFKDLWNSLDTHREITIQKFDTNIKIQFADSQANVISAPLAEILITKKPPERFFIPPANDINYAVNTNKNKALTPEIQEFPSAIASGNTSLPAARNPALFWVMEDTEPKRYNTTQAVEVNKVTMYPVAESTIASMPSETKAELLPVPSQHVYSTDKNLEEKPFLPITLRSKEKEGAALSQESKNILYALPPEKVTKKLKMQHINLEHEQPNHLEEEDIKRHKDIGIEMTVRKPKADIFRLLENAYDELMSGNAERAIELYRYVLQLQPNNKLALFGLATTYHRTGQIRQARALYGKLLAIDPENVEGLNNFLVLLSDESPVEAITEMEKLEKSHPNFSPIPAQLAIIYAKIPQYDNALGKMKRAIEISPENLKYRYDMAIMLDKAGDWQDAGVFYQQVLTAMERGEKFSANAEEIQERLTFIVSTKGKRN